MANLSSQVRAKQTEKSMTLLGSIQEKTEQTVASNIGETSEYRESRLTETDKLKLPQEPVPVGKPEL